MTLNVLEDTAYLIATGQCLTESFTKEQYDEMNEEQVYLYVWQPFENFSSSELCSEISNLVELIVSKFRHLVSE